LRRETLGVYDKGKVGLVLEEQVLLVDEGTGEVYTKFIGSSFFVGQVFSRIRIPLGSLFLRDILPELVFGIRCIG